MLDNAVTMFRWRNIPIKVHWTLLLFLPFLAISVMNQFTLYAWTLGLDPADSTLPVWLWGLLLAVGLFVGILLHELAHTAVALKSGAKIHSITLMMLGGVTRIREEVRPEREAWMAFAGPLASLAIAAASWALHRFAPLSPDARVAAMTFAGINFTLAVFNLLPAFPMDGGRVLRGLLVRRMGRLRATQVATTGGKVMAVAFVLFGLLTFNLLLVLIAAFVWIGAQAERAQLESRDILHGVTVGDLMTDRLGEVHAGEPLAAAGRLLWQRRLEGAKVVADPPGDPTHEHHQLLGIVTTKGLVEQAQRGAADAPVETAMHTDVPVVHADDDASTTLDALAAGEAPAVVVVDRDDRVIGLVTSENIWRAVQLAKLSTAGRHLAAAPSQ